MDRTTLAGVSVGVVVALVAGTWLVFLQDAMLLNSAGVILTIAGLMGVMFVVRFSFDDPADAVDVE